MRYIVSGRSTSIDKYLRENPLETGEKWCRCRKYNHLEPITMKDSLVLLPGWWMEEKVIDRIKGIIQYFPDVVEYHDGKFGEEWREKNWQSETTYDRFDLLDFGSEKL